MSLWPSQGGVVGILSLHLLDRDISTSVRSAVPSRIRKILHIVTRCMMIGLFLIISWASSSMDEVV
jgi:TRAP-type C4-dicarboxylate transport system permease small subunit